MAIDISELRKLPPASKLEIINVLWDDLQHAGPLQLPEAELDEIERRHQRMLDHPEETLTTEQMWARVEELLEMKSLRYDKQFPDDLLEAIRWYSEFAPASVEKF